MIIKSGLLLVTLINITEGKTILLDRNNYGTPLN